MKKRSLFRILAVALTLVLMLQCMPLAGFSPLLTAHAATSQVSVPTFSGGTLHRTVQLSNSNVGIYYTGATEAEFLTYVNTTMVNAGFELLQTNSIGANRYATLLSEGGMAHVALTAAEGTLYIITDPLTTTALKTEEPSYTKVTDTTFSIFSLEYSHYTCAAGCEPKYDNNGQCYIVTLEDGRYVISDGGYPQDAQRLYNFLSDNNKRPDGEIVIAAWFLSHDHEDHVGCFQEFAATHGRDVTLQSVVANPTVRASSGYSGTFLTATLPNLLKNFKGDADLVIPHTGQIYTYCNVDFEFYYTHEDMYHNNGSVGSNGNNTSTVFQMTYGGQTFMIASDLMDAGCNRIVAMHGGNMKSDFFQIPHHGNSGCTIGFYEAVDPTYTLWTTSEPAFGKRTSGQTYSVGMPSSYTASLNRRIYLEVGAANCWYADGPVEMMRLPYSATSAVSYYTPSDEWIGNSDEPVGPTIYSENFDSLTPGNYSAEALKELLDWYWILPTAGSTFTITADHKLRIYNPHASGADLKAGIGKYNRLVDHTIVLEYDFCYTNRNDSEGTSHASFVMGQYISESGDCLQPTITAQGFQQSRMGTKTSAPLLYAQVRPEWIPYTKTQTGYNYPYGSVKNHYNIFGGTNHVRVVLDPTNGVNIYVNDKLISTPLVGKTWRSTNYDDLIGSLFGISLSPGIDVTWDNIRLYEIDAERPELLITELGTTTGNAEFIELYNNSDRTLNLYDYCIVRNPDLTKVGTNWGAPDTFQARDIATIKAGTHTYRVAATGQAVTLTNPVDGSILPGESVVLWIATNTTYENSGYTPNGYTVEKFRTYHGLDDSVRVFACYNNYNFSLNNGGDIGYGVGYASENYVGRNTSSLEDLVCYVYANTTAEKLYGHTVGVSKYATVGATVEYSYAENNMSRQGMLYEAKTTTKSVGRALAAQKRTVDVTVEGTARSFALGLNDLSSYVRRTESLLGVSVIAKDGTRAFYSDLTKVLLTDGAVVSAVRLTVDTLTGASVRTSRPTGIRWITSVRAEELAEVKRLMEEGWISELALGTVVIRTRDLQGDALTLERVNNVDCFKIEASTDAWFEETPTVEKGYGEALVGTHLFAGSVVNLMEKHYTVAYSAVGYVSVTVADGTTKTVYGGYSEAEHSRTVAEVAYRALQDPNHELSSDELEVITGFADYYLP